jgi:hypothetical protein
MIESFSESLASLVTPVLQTGSVIPGIIENLNLMSVRKLNAGKGDFRLIFAEKRTKQCH